MTMATATTTQHPGQQQALATTAAGTVARQEFGATQLQRTGETASSAAAAQAQALVQARYVMALQRPRDLDDVRVKIMREVERPGFAEVAWFRKPVGDGVEGFTIRFAEAAMRCMTNIMPEALVLYDDPRLRVLRVVVTDLESNLPWTKDEVVEKTVERRKLRQGQEAISVRQNSNGQVTYLVEATEDELRAKEGSIVSKTTRTLALRLVPGDIQDAAKKRILEIRHGDAAKDPEGARKRVVDAFAGLNVMPSDLKRYLGHDVAAASPAEIQDLRDLYSTLKAGEATWAEVLAEKLGEQAAAEAQPGAATKPGLAGLTEKLQGQQQAAQAPAVGCTHEAIAALLATCPPVSVVDCKVCGEQVPGRMSSAAADRLAAAAEAPTPEQARADVEKLASTTTTTERPARGKSQRSLQE
jgi:hypothetical protein